MSAPKILICIPNMLEINAPSVQQMFVWGRDKGYEISFYNPTEARFHDYARNLCAEKLLACTDPVFEWLLFLDSDAPPHPQLLSMVELNKPICAGVVFCWIENKLMPSVWELAECEECRMVERFVKHDDLSKEVCYVEVGDEMQRWNPMHQTFMPFVRRAGSGFEYVGGRKCRCQGTGWDPWVYRVDKQIYTKNEPFRTASVGGAATLIRRDVIEKVGMPGFQFLYKPTRQILLTEDHYFCWKARVAGFEVWCDPRLTCSHYKRVDLRAVNDSLREAYKVGATSAQIDVSPIIQPTAQDVLKVNRLDMMDVSAQK